MRRHELTLGLLVLAGIGVAIVLSRPEPPDESLFEAVPARAAERAPLVAPGGAHAVTGRVTTAAGQPAQDAFVVLLPPSGAPGESAPLHHAYTDANGRFALEGLPPGTLRVVLTHPSAPPRVFTLEVPAPGELLWNLAEPLPELPALTPLARTQLVGALGTEEGFLESYEDLAGFEIWLVPTRETPLLAGAAERRTTTDARGGFAFAELVLAPYEARCLPPWARGGTWPILARATVTLEPGAASTVGLALEVGALAGRISESGGRPLAGAIVSVAALDALDPVGQPSLWPPVAADAQGAFRVELLPPGRYLVHARAGAARGDVEVQVAAGRTTPVPLGPLDPAD